MRADLCTVETGIARGNKMDEVRGSTGRFSDSAGGLGEISSDDVFVCAGNVDAAGIKWSI